MKKIALFVCILLLSAPAFAQKIKSSKVPTSVKSAFSQKFPNLKAEKWEMEEGNYEAEFDGNGDVEMSALFSADGKWLETEQEIKKSALPASILNQLSGKKIKEASKINRADGSVLYEAEIKGKDYLYDATGKAVN